SGKRADSSADVVRRLPAMGQKLGDTAGRVLLHTGQDVSQVRDRVDAVFFAGSDERVVDGKVVSGVLVSEKEVVASAERNAAQRSFGDIVVGRDRRETQETSELAEIPEQVANGSPHRRARRESSAMPTAPTQEPCKQRSRPLLAQVQVSVRS